jgi:hypothetical protein
MKQNSCRQCAELEAYLYGIVATNSVEKVGNGPRTCYACGEVLQGDYYSVNFDNSMSGTYRNFLLSDIGL